MGCDDWAHPCQLAESMDIIRSRSKSWSAEHIRVLFAAIRSFLFSLSGIHKASPDVRLSPSVMLHLSLHAHIQRWVSRSRTFSVSKLCGCSALWACADHDIDHNAVSFHGRISPSYGPARGPKGRQMETIEFDLRSTSRLPWSCLEH